MDNDFDTVVSATQELLNNYPGAAEVRNYLDHRIDKTTQKQFRFGYYPDQEHFSALSSLVDESVLLRTRLRYERYGQDGIYRKSTHSTFEHHNLVLPYQDLYGTTVALVGRTVLTDQAFKKLEIPKYRNTSFEKSSHVFCLDKAKQSVIKHNSVLVVEGQFDCIQAHQHGIDNVVAMGTSSMTMYQLSLLLRYTENIYLFLDNDEAGLKGTERIIDRFGMYAQFKCKTIPPGYKDLDEFLKDNDNIILEDLINM